MFEPLADRFDTIFRRLRSRGRLNEADVDEVAREIRLALLEADVNVRVVKAFVARLKARATGAEVAESLSPAQQVIKIVNQELVAILGGEALKISYASRPPTVVLLRLGDVTLEGDLTPAEIPDVQVPLIPLGAGSTA